MAGSCLRPWSMMGRQAAFTCGKFPRVPQARQIHESYIIHEQHLYYNLITLATTIWYIICHTDQPATCQVDPQYQLHLCQSKFNMATATNSTFYELYRSSSYACLALRVIYMRILTDSCQYRPCPRRYPR
jgi:hypothetical protein